MISDKLTQKAIDHHKSRPEAKNAKDLTGMRFGKLTVIGDPRRYQKGTQSRTYWHCACDCGEQSFVVASSLNRGLTKSCGCDMRAVLVTHGLSQLCSKTYASWNGIIQRCTNPNTVHYESYGGSGVVVCERWNQYVNFIGDMGLRPKGKTIDRYDPEWRIGDPPIPYSSETCRWATNREQQNNRYNNVFIEYGGMRLTPAQWGRRTDISADAIAMRIKRGWAVEKALTTPMRAQP